MIDKLLLLFQYVRRTEVWRSIFRRDHLPRTTAERISVISRNFFVHLWWVGARESKRALAFSYTWYMGAISLWLYFVTLLTGIFLMFYYIPSVERAYNSILEISNVVTLGRFTRNLHRWSANLMVVTVTIHMIRVFFTGSYQKPRQFNWVLGVLLFVFTYVMGFTGYLLPWDQLAYWAASIASNIAGATPFFGDQAKFALFGGTELGQPSLIRFYVTHVILFPAVMLLFIFLHIWRVRADGLSKPLRKEQKRESVGTRRS
ncbi:MAG: cytochrome b N-terminal domain-containing protein [Candidatus Bipolaricaulia bacterium]